MGAVSSISCWSAVCPVEHRRLANRQMIEVALCAAALLLDALGRQEVFAGDTPPWSRLLEPVIARLGPGGRL